MFGIGGFELFIILVFGFIIFGPEKLPEIARTVGKAIARFRQAQDEMNDVIKATDLYDPNSDEPFKDPMEALDKLAKHQEEKRADASKKAVPKKVDKPTPTATAQTAKRSSADAAGSVSAEDAADQPRQESFTERKARYERERAARKAAEEKAARGAESLVADDVAVKKNSSGTDSADQQTPKASTEASSAEVKAEGGEQ